MHRSSLVYVYYYTFSFSAKHVYTITHIAMYVRVVCHVCRIAEDMFVYTTFFMWDMVFYVPCYTAQYLYLPTATGEAEKVNDNKNGTICNISLTKIYG